MHDLLTRLEHRLLVKSRLEDDGSKGAKEKVRRYVEDAQQTRRLGDELSFYFNRADSGPYEDERMFNDLVGLLVGNVLNNPKTSITQFITPIIGPAITYKGANMLTLGSTIKNIRAGLRMGAESVLQGLGWHFKQLPENQRIIGELVGGLNEAGMSFGEQTVVTGKGSQFESRRGRVHKFIRQGRKVLDLQVGAKGGATRTPIRGPTGVFRWVASLANYATAVGQLNMVQKVSEQVAHYMDAHGEWNNESFDPSNPKVLRKLLGLGYTLNPLFGKADTLKLLFRQIEERFSMNFADFVRMQRQREREGQRTLNYNDIAAIVQIAEDEISLNAGMNSRPTWFFKDGIKPLTMLWGWPVMQTERVASMTTNETGELDRRVLLKMAATMGLFAMPASLIYSLLLDLYDEIFRGRAPNLRKPGLDKSAEENLLTTVERLARMGTFGMGGDVINSMVNWTEYNGRGANPVSLDDRILLMSSAHNLINAIRNATMQQDVSYATVGRPLINAFGGNSFLQYVQLWNQATDRAGDTLPGPVGGVLNKEGKFVKRSNVYNIVRAAGREAGLPLSQGGGFSLPNKRTMHLREMQFAALDNDTKAFGEHYIKAVKAYMTDPDIPRSYNEAVKTVKSSWHSRHPLRTLFKKKLSSAEEMLLYSKMPVGNRKDVQEAVMLHELYENLLGSPPVTFIQNRRSEPVKIPAAPF